MKTTTKLFVLASLALGAACTSTSEVQDTAPAPPVKATVAAVADTPPVEAPPVEAAPVEAAPVEAVPRETAAEKLPPARGIIDAFIEKTGARKTFEETDSAYLTGTFEMAGMGMGGPMEVYAAKPDKLYLNISMEGMGEFETGYDGKVGWEINAMTGAVLKQGVELYQLRLQAEYDTVLKDPAKYLSMETVGREVFEDQDCFVIEYVRKPHEGMDPEETKDVRTFREYYNVETGLLDGMTGTAASPMGETKVKTVTTEYKELGGQLMATKTTQESMGMVLEITIETIEFDTVEAEVFALPKQIQALLEDED